MGAQFLDNQNGTMHSGYNAHIKQEISQHRFVGALFLDNQNARVYAGNNAHIRQEISHPILIVQSYQHILTSNGPLFPEIP